MINKITLSEETYIARGHEKIVHFHPEDAQKIIKVINPDYTLKTKRDHAFTFQIRRLKRYWCFLNIIKEHIASREDDIDRKFLQNTVGLVDTNMGLGLVVEAVLNGKKEPAKTLRQIIESKEFSNDHSKALSIFLIWLKKSNIIVRDLSLENLVWNSGDKHFVLIDGIGSKYLPSLRNYFKLYNLRGNRKRAEKLKRRANNLLKKYSPNENITININ